MKKIENTADTVTVRPTPLTRKTAKRGWFCELRVITVKIVSVLRHSYQNCDILRHSCQNCDILRHS